MSGLRPSGIVEIPRDFEPFLRRKQWIVPHPAEAWLSPKLRELAIKEMARVTKGWARWIIEERSGSPRSHDYSPRLILRAIRSRDGFVTEVAIDFPLKALANEAAFKSRLALALPVLAQSNC